MSLIFQLSLILGFCFFIYGCSHGTHASNCKLDYYDIGLKDGLNGGKDGHLRLRHVECRLGTDKPPQDKPAYDRGLADGLAKYCTSKGVFMSGLNGAYEYSFKCKQPEHEKFLELFKKGREVFDLRAKLNSTEGAIIETLERIQRNQNRPEEVRRSNEYLEGQKKYKEETIAALRLLESKYGLKPVPIVAPTKSSGGGRFHFGD